MAEIPVKEKSGIPGWVWVLLVLILVALLAWWLLSDDGDEVEYIEDETVATAPMVDEGWMVGETVQLSSVQVGSLAGDMAFNIEQNGEQWLVVFDQTPTPGDATEGEYDINPGSILDLTGEVRSADQPLPSDVDAQIPAGTDRYIYATSIEMLN